MNSALHIITLYSHDDLNVSTLYSFLRSFSQCDGIQLHIIEIANSIDQFSLVIDSKYKHYKIISPTLFPKNQQKELLNNVLQSFLPYHWKYMTYCDYTISFSSMDWITKVKSLFDQKYSVDLIQLYSTSRHINSHNLPIKYQKGLIYSIIEFQSNNGEMGYAWACSRKGYHYLNHYFHLLFTFYHPLMNQKVELDEEEEKIETIEYQNFLQNTKNLTYTYIHQLITIKENEEIELFF